MKLYLKILSNSFKTMSSFRFDYIINIMFSLTFLTVQVYTWKALFAYGVNVNGNVDLNGMIAYSIIGMATSSVTSSGIMKEINAMVLSGEIGHRLLLPVNFKRHFLYTNVSQNIFNTLYNCFPQLLIGILIFHLNFDFRFLNLPLFIISLILGFFINFYFNFIMGLTVFWLKNSYFLGCMTSAVTTLFSGRTVPLWFFPSWLLGISVFLPFRYIIFEPTSILLGVNSYMESGRTILIQILWILILYILSEVVWKSAQKIVFAQGG